MTILLVQSKSFTGTSATALSGSLTTGTTATGCVVVGVGMFDGTDNMTVSGMTLGGSADHFAPANAQSSNSAVNSAIWSDQDCAGGQTAIAVAMTGGTGSGPEAQAWAMEFSGVATSGAVDKAPTGSSNTTGTTWSSNSTGMLSQPFEVGIGVVACTSAPTTPGSPWTELGSLSAASLHTAVAYQIVSSTTALVYNGTMPSGDDSTAIIVTLLAASSSVTGTVAVTQAPLAVSAAGSVAATGTVAVAQAPLTVAASGGVEVTGTVAVTQAPLTVSAEGTSTPPSLLISITPAAGTDEYGHAIPAGGFTSYYDPGEGTGVVAMNLNAAGITWYAAQTQAGPYQVIGSIGIPSFSGPSPWVGQMEINGTDASGALINIMATAVNVNGTPIS